MAVASIMLFAAAQGAAIFATAFLALRILKASRTLAKAAAMIVSYTGWAAFTVVAYALLGGGGGLMEGFGLVLFLCFTAFASSLAYLVAWSFWPSKPATD